MPSWRNLLLALAVPLAASCESPTGGGETKPGPPAQLSAVSGGGQSAAVGTKLSAPLVVRVTDAAGTPLSGVAVAWTVASGGGSLSTATATTDASGEARAEWTLGGSLGAQSATATVSGLAAVAFTAQATAGPPARVERVSGDGQTATVGSALSAPLAVRVTDAAGNPVAGATVTWQSTGGGGALTPGTSTTDATGLAQAAWTLGSTPGANTATATVSGISVSFGATATAVGATLVIQSVSPATLTPGATATLTGSGFSPTPAGNAVTIDGVAATVTAASATQLTITLPAAAAFPCEPTRSVTVAVTAGPLSGARSHPLQVAAQRSLSPGQTLFLDAGAARCNELAQAGGRYVLSVFNTSESVNAQSPFQLRLAAAAATAPPPAGLAPAQRPSRAAAAVPGGGEPAAAAHERLLEMNRDVLHRLGPGFAARRRAGASPSFSRAAAPLAVGDTVPLRIGNIKAPRYCQSFSSIVGRVVYAGKYAVVIEDRTAPLAGRMDAEYRAVGEEFDNRMMDILRANFGEPLAVDPATDANGKILMVFSKVVNDFGNVAGFVLSGDLFPREECGSSNQAEIFYAVVPTNEGTGFGSGTVSNWKWTMPSTIIHEVKHITSFAERLSRSATAWEASWLEESTARISEELWARAVYGYAAKSNVDYQASMYCESRPSWVECAGRPLVMRKHFGGLYDYMSANESRTPLGSAEEGDASFYGSGWSLVRWSIDHFASSEAGFLRALTQEPRLSGLRNLEARTGRTWPQLLGSWSLALAVDDQPQFTVSDPLLRFPSWNLRDAFAGLNRDFPNVYTRAYPLGIRPVVFGNATVDVPAVRGGSAAIFDLSGASAGRQVVELRAVGGGDPAPTLRLGIVRVQ